MAEPTGPSPEVRAKLMQLRAEFAQRAEIQRRLQLGQQNAEEAAKKYNLPLLDKADGGQVEMDKMRLELMGKGGLMRDKELKRFLSGSKDKRRMYHGTTGNIKEFYKDTTFLSPDPKFASGWSGHEEGQEGANVMPLHAQVRNPFDYSNKQHVKKLINYLKTHPETPKFLEDYDIHDLNDFAKSIPFGSYFEIEPPHIQNAIKKLGHDAFYVNEGTGNMVKNLGVYDPRKIKSAIGNRGTYDITNPDITKKNGGITHAHQLEIEERPL